MTRIVLVVSASIWIIPATLCMAQPTLGWPEVIALLTKARTQATTCVEVLKSSGDKTALASARLTLWHGRGGDGRGHRRADDGPRRRRRSRSRADGSNEPRDLGKGPQGDLRRRGQDDYPEHERRVGRARQGRGRTVVQDDFRRRRRALDAPCRKRQARTRDEKSQFEAAKWPKFADIAAAQ